MDKQLIQHLHMQPHPEGGWYAEVHRSTEMVPRSALSEKFNKDSDGRPMSTAIFFLLDKGNFSAFHKIASEELWDYHAGGSIFVHVLLPADNSASNSASNDTMKVIEGAECSEGKLRLKTIRLGSKFQEGDLFKYIVPAGCWFASEPAPARQDEPDWVLVGCTVCPGFDFRDFVMAQAEKLVPLVEEESRSTVARLCRE